MFRFPPRPRSLSAILPVLFLVPATSGLGGGKWSPNDDWEVVRV